MEVDYAAMGSRVRRLRLAQHMTQEQPPEPFESGGCCVS